MLAALPMSLPLQGRGGQAGRNPEKGCLVMLPILPSIPLRNREGDKTMRLQRRSRGIWCLLLSVQVAPLLLSLFLFATGERDPPPPGVPLPPLQVGPSSDVRASNFSTASVGVPHGFGRTC